MKYDIIYPYPALRKLLGADYENEVERRVTCPVCKAARDTPCVYPSRMEMPEYHSQRATKGSKFALRRLRIFTSEDLNKAVEVKNI